MSENKQHRAFKDLRDPRVEKWIEGYGVKWEFVPDININSMIDVEGGLHNQARFDRLDADVTRRYARYLLDGVDLPPIVLHAVSQHRLVTIDGNHRIAANLEAAKTDPVFSTIAGYLVVGASPETISVMTMEANARHGKPTSTEERVSHAVWLSQTGGMSASRAANRLGVDPHLVMRAIRREKNMLRATQAGLTLKEWDAIGQFAQDRLSAIKTNEGLRAAVKLVAAAKLRQIEVVDLVRQANATAGGAEQKKIIEGVALGYGDRIEALAGGALDKGRSKRGLSAKQRMLLSLGQVANLPEDPSAMATLFRPAEVPVVRERLQTSLERLQGLLVALGKREES